MRIDSPIMTNAIITGSFSGSFVGAGNFTALEADSVEFANVLNKPTLISSSAQITALGYSTTDNELTTEEVQDIAGALVATGGTKTGITITYQDATNDIDFVVASQTDENFTTADHAKLDGIEASADVTDATNVTAAGALMDSELSEIATVKALTAAGISGSFTAASASFSTRVTANDAKLTANTSNVTSAGALMDSELTSITDVKALDQSVISGASPTFGTANFTDASNKRLMTDAQETKLDSVETNADVTDATNVAAAGALMDSEVTNLAEVKAFDSSDYATAAQGAKADSAQQPPSEGAFANGDKTKLDGIEASADVTDTTNVTAAGALMDSELTNLAAVKAINQGLATGNDVQFNDLTLAGDLTVNGTTVSINATNLDVTDKLISINKGGADAASANGGGLFISGANESLTWDNGNSRFSFSDDLHAAGNITLTGTVDGRDVATDGTKLDGIEASATADQSAAEIRTLVESATDSNVFTDADHSKLNGIESSATADQSDAEIRAAVEAATDSNVFTDADHSKLNGIEASADVTDATNVTAAGALMDSECTSLADVKALDQSVVSGASPTFGTANMTDASNKRFMTDAQETKLDSVETNADVTDATNVTAAGALMDSELTNLAAVKAINQSLVTTADVRFDSIGIGTAAPGTSGVIRATNDIVAFYSSDERLKDNIEEIPNALSRIEDIRGVQFDWNDKQSVYEGHDIGVIAQEIEKVAPSLVTDRDNGYKAVKYEKLTAILIQAVKELSAKVKELEKK